MRVRKGGSQGGEMNGEYHQFPLVLSSFPLSSFVHGAPKCCLDLLLCVWWCVLKLEVLCVCVYVVCVRVRGRKLWCRERKHSVSWWRHVHDVFFRRSCV